MIRQRRSVMSGLAVAVVLGLSVLAVGPAWATGPLMTRNRAVRTGASDSGAPSRALPGYPANTNLHNFGPSYPFGYNYAGPSYPFGRNYGAPSYGARPPVYAAPPPPQTPAFRWVQGYWAQQWVPQYYTYDAWVPGYYTRNSGWVQGYYETRTAESGGYYQQVWVDGHWAE